MRSLTAGSSLRIVAETAGAALKRAEVEAVLTGGACASLHSAGAHLSQDIDFVLAAEAPGPRIPGALSGIGFHRVRDRFEHGTSPFWIEFPRGPLAIGGDLDIEPVLLSSPRGPYLSLSATDSCRDRLAAFYHWDDPQSLEVALAIARRNVVDLERIRRWSRNEGKTDAFRLFRSRLARRGSSKA